MKRYGELILNAYEIEELIQAFTEQTEMEVDSLTNKEGDVCGASWRHLGCEVTLLVPEKIEDELDFLIGIYSNSIEEIKERNTALIEKLFLPWELHLPLYIVVDDCKETSEDIVESMNSQVWLKSLVRIIAEELMDTVGAWIPANKELFFLLDTWDYDVELQKHEEVVDADVSDFFNVVETRYLKSNYHIHFM